jgi:hypothetical protein
MTKHWTGFHEPTYMKTQVSVSGWAFTSLVHITCHELVWTIYTFTYEGVSKSFRTESLRSNTRGHGSKTNYSDSQKSDTTAPIGRELYHLQFSLQAASPKTFRYTVVYTRSRSSSVCIVTRLQAGRPGFNCRQGLGISSISHCVQTGSGAHPAQ